eukprot:g6338.t1
MAVLSKPRREAFEEVRTLFAQKKAEAEEKAAKRQRKEEEDERIAREEAGRLNETLTDLEELLDMSAVKKIMNEWEEARLPHIVDINKSYVNYDTEYKTRQMNSWVWGHLGRTTEYLDEGRRAMLFAKEGRVNKGFDVHGKLPIYGAWNGRKLTDDEVARYEEVQEGEVDYNIPMAEKTKMRSGPYAFETKDVQDRSAAAVVDLLGGVLGVELQENELDPDKYTFPFFGIGQKVLDDGTYKKARPIANEKLRNLMCSPIAEHLTLPGIPDIIQGILTCLNPGYTDPHDQARRDVTKGVTQGRKRKAEGKMSWKDISTLPLPHPEYSGTSFVPAIGKIDLYRAYMQYGVRDPKENQFMLYDPKKEAMRYGRMNCMTFGNGGTGFIFKEIQKLAGLLVHAFFTRKHKRSIPVTRFLYNLTSNERQFLKKVESAREARKHGWRLAPPVSKIVKKYGKKNNWHNDPKLKIEWFEDKKVRRARAKPLVGRKQAKEWPLSSQSILTIWRDEDWYMRNGGSYLLDCGYLNPDAYVSVVGMRLRALNVLEQHNPHASVLMAQTFARLGALMLDHDSTKALPPNLSLAYKLTARERAIFSLWMQSGLRPRSLLHVRPDMIKRDQMSPWAEVAVPVVKVDPKPGEVFKIFVPAALVHEHLLPFTISDLAGICKTLGTTLYGPRRALALWFRIRAAELGIYPKLEDGKSDNPAHVIFKCAVCTHMGWTPTSTMWEDEYTIDVFQHQYKSFHIHPLMYAKYSASLFAK